ncbi:MAG: glycosyltransferase [Wenzhouxiangella sp.]
MRLLSAIVPLGPDEPPPLELLSTVGSRSHVEVIVSATDAGPRDLPEGISWLADTAGRGRQLNRGARNARGEWLWFVHADSRFEADTVAAILRFVRHGEPAIGYCDLRYLADGPAATRLNAIGANLRSRLLGLPYGDQGLCVPSDWFGRLNGFREDLERGEDLDFVVRARQAGLPARPVGAPIHTSARRYRVQGWLTTTWRHQVGAWRLIRDARRSARSKPA